MPITRSPLGTWLLASGQLRYSAGELLAPGLHLYQAKHIIAITFKNGIISIDNDVSMPVGSHIIIWITALTIEFK
eukprot:scaffold271248_cov17-Prasinocladus_malaysianus.AAC.1